MSLTVSIMNGVTNSHPTTSEEANGLATDFVSEGVIGTYTNTGSAAPTTGAFSINAQGTPDMTVAVGSGVAYVQGTPASQNSQMFRVYNSASENVTISANSSGSTKYDWLYIKLDATLLNAPTLAGTTTATLVTSRSTSSSSDDGTPPTYGYPIAVITVSNGASSITNSVIRDIRGNADIGTVAGQNTGWTSGALPAVSSVTENGNRSANITFASTVAAILTPGMRIRTSRTVAAPTQSTSLNGTTQYYSKSSPNKLTFTDDFVVSAWVKLTSYTAGSVASRYNGTSGWQLLINGSGQVILNGFNAGAANYSQVVSYQSLPLNRWVHIAAQLDMSSFTATTTTSYVMIDGTDLPCSVGRGGTNPTALVQAGDLQIGAANGSSFFPGAIAQVAIYNAKVTQANIRATKNQTLSGSETSIASAYSFNNVITDLNTTTPNDLTANGSAVATNAASPFTTDANGTAAGTYDFAIVTKVATTVATVQYPEGCAIPTSGGISKVDYSGVKAPFSMPVGQDRWIVESLTIAVATQASPTPSTWYNLASIKLNIPVGAFSASYESNTYFSSTGAAPIVATTLSTGAATASDQRNTASARGPAAGVLEATLVRNNIGLNLSAATDYYLNHKQEGTGGGTWSMQVSPSAPTRVYVIPAHL